MSVSFNTTSVATLDKLGKLYKTAIPLSDDTASEALVYSTSAIAENKLVPTTAVYLKHNDAISNDDKSFFSIDRIGKNINLVASGTTLNLYVYNPPGTGELAGSLDKYQFDAATGVQKDAVPALINPIDIAKEELIANRDLDGNAGIGGLLPTTNSTLDKVGNLFKVKVADQDMLIVGTAVSAKSKSIDIAANVLKTSDGMAWMPDVTYDNYSAVKSASGWEIFAVKNSSDLSQAATVTQYSFDANRKLVVTNFSENKVLNANELAKFEKFYGRNLNNDSFMGVAITTPIDAAGGLYKANILNEDFYVVDTTGNGLKSGTTAATALDLSGTLMADDGVSAWKETEGYTLRSMVKSTDGSNMKVFLTKISDSPTDPKTVLQFDFNLDITSRNFLIDPANPEGIEINPTAFAAIEKASKRDLNKDGDFGIKVGANLDKAGGLYMAEVLGRTYLVAGKNLISNSKNITDLSSALTIGGAAWKPEGMTDSQLTGKINIVINSSTSATVFVKDDDGFAKYDFTRSGTTPWVTEGQRVALEMEEMAAIEKATGRDLNNDKMFGAQVVSLKDARGGLYTASYDTLGSNNSNPIFIRSTSKLSLGASTAANAVSFASALKTGSDFWTPPADYTVTAAYQDPDASVKKYHVIVVNDANGINTSDFKRFSFNTDTSSPDSFNKLDEASSSDISAKELSVIESQLKRDLNDDKIIGARVLATLDKVGLLFKVQGSSKESNGEPVVTFATKANSTSLLNNLSASFVLENGDSWKPEGFSDSTKLTLITHKNGLAVTGYDIYTKNEVDNQNVFVKYSFDANYTLKSEKAVTLVDLANDETATSRDINGDGILGAKVLNAIDKVAGLYRVSIEDKFMLVASSPGTPPVKQTSLRNVLLGEESSPLQLNANSEILDEKGITTGYKVRSAFIDPSDDAVLKLFATKTNTNGTLGDNNTADDFNDVKQIAFKVNSNSLDYADYKRIDTSAVLNAKSLVDAEKASGKDLNSDLAVGVKISSSVDKRGGLYSSKILGATYYFYDSLNKKSGSSTGTAIDLSTAFLDEESNPWQLTDGFSIGGVVKNDSNGYDIYTYKKNVTPSPSQFEYEVIKHSWDDSFLFIGSQAADAAALVSVEKDNARDFSGDGTVGFKLINIPSLKGVTQAQVLGGQESKFLIVGEKLKPGSPTTPWKLTDALLTQDGTGPWSPPAGFSVTAVRDSGSSRYVYAQNSLNASSVNQYVFDKVTGKFSGTEQPIDAIQLATEEIEFSKDLNGDAKLGVYQFTDVKVGSIKSGLGMSAVAGKSSGLMQMKNTINGIDYLVAQITPNPNTRVNLEMALLNADGTAWMPESGFTLAGIYKPEGTGKTEVYGTTASGSFVRYEFTLTNLVTENLASELGYSSTPQVLKLSQQTVNDVVVNYKSVTDIEVADREEAIQKDLNNDNLVGFKLGTKLDSLANGTTLATAGMGSGANLSQIYIVGKSVANLGGIGYGTANGSALRRESDSNKVYWQPNENYEVKSVVESTDSIKVYSSIKISALATVEAETDPSDTFDANQMLEDTFTKDGTNGWLLQSSGIIRNSDWIISTEIATKRDLNKDTFTSFNPTNNINGIGLAYKSTDAFNLANTGLIKGNFGNKEYIFAGQNLSSYGTFAKPLGLTNAGGPQLLKDADNKAWTTTNSIQNFAAKNSTTSVPTNIDSSLVAYVLTYTDSAKGRVYFDSTYKALTASPVLNTNIDLLDRTLTEDVKFSFYLPEFATAEEDDRITYSYTAKYSDGSSVPNVSEWLSLDSSTGNFTGTPTNANVTDSDFTVTVKATSLDSVRFVSSSFKVEVKNSNDVPVRTAINVPNVNLEVGSSFEFFLPEGSFSDDDGANTLTYSFTDDSGLADLDKWLNLDSYNQRFSGTVPNSWTNGSMSVTVKASDSSSDENESSYATASFTINFNNKPTAPELGLVDQTVTIGQAFEYLLDSQFSDNDNDNLTLSATQDGGAPLPTWLEFDASNAKFRYTPDNATSNLVKDLTVKVTASDGRGSTAESSFNITVNEAPQLVYPLDDIFVKVNTIGSFVIPSTSFADPEGTSLTYTATLGNGNDLPYDLEFISDTLTFRYNESLDLTNALNIKVTASDGKGTSSGIFKLDKQ